MKDGKEEMIPAEKIRQGDILRILPGETIPVDGTITNGETSVDQSIMTGESLPVDKGVGEDVFCGTINRFGAIDILATKVGENSLTYGRLDVSDIYSFDKSLSETELLSLVASAEAKSEHPLGKAIVAYAKKQDVSVTESTVFRMTAGKGIYAEVPGRNLLCGNEKYLAENGVITDNKVQNILEQLRRQGKASILVADGKQCIGVIALSDVLRPEAKDMVSRLNAMHTRTVLLTGDNKKTADYFASHIGISEIRRIFCRRKKSRISKNYKRNAEKFV